MTSNSLLRVSLLTVFALAVFVTPVLAETEAQDLPTARAIFDRFVEVTNGTVVEEHSVRKTVGSFSIPSQGLNGNMTIWQKAPNLFYSEVELAGVGKIREGFDGTTAWSSNPLQGPQIFEGEARAQKVHQANFYQSLYRPDDVEAATVVALSSFEGEPAYEIDITRTGGQRSKDYFSVESGLLLGLTMEIVDPMGTFPARMILSRYEEINGMVMPTQTTISVMGMQQVVLTDEILHEEFDDSIFDLPAEIAAMVEE